MTKPTLINVNGMNGIKATTESSGFLPVKAETIVFETNKDFVSLIFMAQPADFEKYSGDFNSTLNSLRISNTLKTPFSDLYNVTSVANTTTPQPVPSTPKILPLPMSQFRSGAASSNVQCNQGFTLIIKAEDGSPACLTPHTAQILIERGWGIASSTTSSQNNSTK